jgi:hypothetical protein
LAFKPGYSYSIFGQPPGITFKDGPTLISYWDGKVAEMKRFEGDVEKYSENIDRFDNPVGYIIEDCGWKKIPNILMALTKQNRIFEKNKTRNRLAYDIDENGFFYSNDKSLTQQCGISPIVFFRSYQP